MSRSSFRTILSVLNAFIILHILKDSSIYGESAYHGISVTAALIPSRNDNLFSGGKSALRSPIQMGRGGSYQRNESCIFLASNDHLPLRNILDQSKVAFINTVRHHHHVTSKAVKYIEDRTSAITSSPSFPHFVAGIAAGALECLVGHPMDTIRVRIITNTGSKLGIIGHLKSAFSTPGGIASLYRGTQSELLSAAVAGSLLFGVNDYLKRILGVPNDANEEEKISPGLMIAAAGTGFLDGITSKPLEMIKLRQQVLPAVQCTTALLVSGAASHSSFGHSVAMLFKSEGVGGFFRGWLPTVLRESLGNAAFFAAYTQTKLFVIELEKKIEIGKVKKLEKNEKRNLLFNSENKIEKQSKSEVIILSKYENEKNGNSGVMSEIKEETRETCDSVSTVNPGTAFRAVLLAGAMAGAAYVISSHPLEIASILMQTDIPMKIPLNNPIISPIINSINGPINAAIKPLFTPIMSTTTTQTLPALLTTVAPSISLLQGLSNSFQNTVSTIAHTARTKGFVSFLQTDRSLSYRYNNMFDCINQAVKADGLAVLYRGAWPSVVRALPSYAVSFWGYELTLQLMERKKLSKKKEMKKNNNGK